MKNEDNRPLADRRAEQGRPADDEEHDFADERTPSPSDPANAPADAPGGEDDGYAPQTQLTSDTPGTSRRGIIGRLRRLFG
ncbi:MAG TPA: hypothetical protein VF069_27275 [Streptosporangiaceae bacterium]